MKTAAMSAARQLAPDQHRRVVSALARALLRAALAPESGEVMEDDDRESRDLRPGVDRRAGRER